MQSRRLSLFESILSILLFSSTAFTANSTILTDSLVNNKSPSASCRLALNQLSGTLKSDFSQTSNAKVHLSGESSFLESVEMLESTKAGDQVDLAYFIWESDFTSSYLARLIQEKAQLGVKFRILIDFLMSESEPEMLAFLASLPNVEVKRFRSPTDDFKSFLKTDLHVVDPDLFLNHLMHNHLDLLVGTLDPRIVSQVVSSLALPEGETATTLTLLKLQSHLRQFSKRLHHKLIAVHSFDPKSKRFTQVRYKNGGRNISDEYFLSLGHPFLANRAYPFFDSDFSATLGAKESSALRRSYTRLWNFPQNLTVSPFVKPSATFVETLMQKANRVDETFSLITEKSISKSLVAGNLVYSENHPDKGALDTATEVLSKNVTRAIKSAKRRVVIVSAYFLFTPDVFNAVREALSKNVRVEIYTNSYITTDLNMVNLAAYLSMPDWIKTFGETGSNFHYYELDLPRGSGSLHAKATFVDDELIEIGSLNKDPRNKMHDTNNGTQVTIDHSEENSDTELVRQIESFYTHSLEGSVASGARWQEIDLRRSSELLSQVRTSVGASARIKAETEETNANKKTQAGATAEAEAFKKFDLKLKALESSLLREQM